MQFAYNTFFASLSRRVGQDKDYHRKSKSV